MQWLLRAETWEPPAWDESWLYHLLACGLGPVTWEYCASVSPSIKQKYPIIPSSECSNEFWFMVFRIAPGSSVRFFWSFLAGRGCSKIEILTSASSFSFYCHYLLQAFISLRPFLRFLLPIIPIHCCYQWGLSKSSLYCFPFYLPLYPPETSQAP